MRGCPPAPLPSMTSESPPLTFDRPCFFMKPLQFSICMRRLLPSPTSGASFHPSSTPTSTATPRCATTSSLSSASTHCKTMSSLATPSRASRLATHELRRQVLDHQNHRRRHHRCCGVLRRLARYRGAVPRPLGVTRHLPRRKILELLSRPSFRGRLLSPVQETR